MRQIRKATERLGQKSDAHTLAQTLMRRYSMSPAEAECLTAELRQKQLDEDPGSLLDGQILYTAVEVEEPAAKPLSACRTRRIRLTLHHPDDLAYRAQQGTAALRQVVVSRLAYEAYQQGALLAQEDLCRLLYLSRATVQRMLAAYRRDGDYVPTRGNYHDIGPLPSHKQQAVRLYLRGCQPTAIAQRLCHTLSSIERYLDDFCRVMAALEAGFTGAAIARFTGHSARLVGEYQALYEQFRDDPACQERLDLLRRRMGRLWMGKKGGLR